MTYFTYNGRSSADFGLHIEKKDVFSAPEYDAEFISIPGRSGDIINPNRRFANIKVTYTVFLARKNPAALHRLHGLDPVHAETGPVPAAVSHDRLLL